MSLALLASATLSQADSPLLLDPAPNFTLRSRDDVSLHVVRNAGNGRLLVLGHFDYVDTLPHARFVRLEADGGIDPTFVAPVVNGSIATFSVGETGAIFIGGSFNTVNGSPRMGLAKLTADGAVDLTFGAVLPPMSPREVHALPDGGCYVVATPPGLVQIHRVTANGTVPAGYSTINVTGGGAWWTFGPNGEVAVVRSNSLGAGSVVVFDGAGALLNLNNAIPPTFRPFGAVFQPDGALVLSGQSLVPGPGLIRIRADGVLDPTFSGISPLPGNWGGGGIIRLGNGTFVTLSGSGAGSPTPHLLHFSPTGVYQTGLVVADGPESAPLNLALRAPAGDDYILTGRFTTVNGTVTPLVARISSDGSVDETFFADFQTRGKVLALMSFGADQELLGGFFTEVADTHVRNVASLSASDIVGTAVPRIPGRVSGGFGTADGGAVLFGEFGTFPGITTAGMVRARADGAIDTTFLNGVSLFGVETGVELPNGAIVLAGRFGAFPSGPTPHPASYLTRVLPDGSIDPTFFNHSTLAGGSPVLTAVGADSQGRIIVAGRFTSFQGAPRAGLARTSPNGVIDPTFVPTLGLATSNPPRLITILPDDRFYVIGVLQNASIPIPQLLRFNSDGSHDTSFAPALSGPALAYVVAPDNSLYVGTGSRLSHVSSTGEVDPSFTHLFNGSINSLHFDTQGRLLVGGTFTAVNGEVREGLARFSPPIPFGAEIDGPSQVTVRLLSSHTFQATVVGASGTPTYQWFHDGTPISGATDQTFTLTHIVPKYEGAYIVTVTDSDESVTTEAVHLIVQRGKPARD